MKADGFDPATYAASLAAPPRPSHYTGTDLEWALKHNHSDEVLRVLLDNLDQLQLREKTAILRRLEQWPRRELVDSLLAAQRRIGNDPATQSRYAAALVAAALGVSIESPRRVAPVPRDLYPLLDVALRMDASRTSEYWDVFDGGDWIVVARRLGRGESVTGLAAEFPAAREAMTTIRGHLLSATAALGVQGKPALEADRVIEAAALAANSSTRETFLDLIEGWERVRPKFGRHPDRRELLALRRMCREIQQGGAADHRSRLVVILLAKKWNGDGEARVVAEVLRGLAAKNQVSVDQVAAVEVKIRNLERTVEAGTKR